MSLALWVGLSVALVLAVIGALRSSLAPLAHAEQQPGPSKCLAPAHLPLIDAGISEEWTPGDPGAPTQRRRRATRRATLGARAG